MLKPQYTKKLPNIVIAEAVRGRVLLLTFLHKMFEVNYLRGSYNKRLGDLVMTFFVLCILTEVLKSDIKSCFDGVSFSGCSYNVISLCCIFASRQIFLENFPREFPYAILL